VRRFPVRLGRPNKLVFSPHEYGPSVFAQPWFSAPNYRELLYDRWEKGFQFIADEGTAPILIGEFGGNDTGTDTVGGRLAASVHGLPRRTRLQLDVLELEPELGRHRRCAARRLADGASGQDGPAPPAHRA
jgi:aryl-phospho-beta-D-glucosidase BglC (GH1 family)